MELQQRSRMHRSRSGLRKACRALPPTAPPHIRNAGHAAPADTRTLGAWLAQSIAPYLPLKSCHPLGVAHPILSSAKLASGTLPVVARTTDQLPPNQIAALCQVRWLHFLYAPTHRLDSNRIVT